ncbi:MAG: hypothetical protein ACREF8_04960, partial [Chthoniobacterales bacterium]
MTPHKIVMYGLGALGWLAAAAALGGFLTVYQNLPAQPYHFSHNTTLGAAAVIVEPQDGMAPVLKMIDNASSSVDLVMYELQDEQVERALAAASARSTCSSC